MKILSKIIIVFLLFFSFFFINTPVNAHLTNQPPFFKVNGKFTPLYPISPDYNTEVNLPQDIGPENYLVNEEINFELDQTFLPVVPQLLNQITFNWDYGDGTKGEGLKSTHV